jgi:hypothetical protein
MKVKKLTAAFLESHNACEDQVGEFNVHFPNGVVPTYAKVEKFQQFDYDWAIRHLFPFSRLAGIEIMAQISDQCIATGTDDWHCTCAEITRRRFVTKWREYYRIKATDDKNA